MHFNGSDEFSVQDVPFKHETGRRPGFTERGQWAVKVDSKYMDTIQKYRSSLYSHFWILGFESNLAKIALSEILHNLEIFLWCILG